MKHLSFWEKTALGTGLCLFFCAVLGISPVMEIKPTPNAAALSSPGDPPPAGRVGLPVDALAQVKLAVRPDGVPAENSVRFSWETTPAGEPKPQPDTAPPAMTGQRNQLQEFSSVTLVATHSN